MLSDRVTNILLFFVLVMIVLTVLFYAVVFLTFSPEDPFVIGITGSAGSGVPRPAPTPRASAA